MTSTPTCNQLRGICVQVTIPFPFPYIPRPRFFGEGFRRSACVGIHCGYIKATEELNLQADEQSCQCNSQHENYYILIDIIETPEKLDSYPASKRVLLRRLRTRHRHYVNFCTILTCLVFCSQTWVQHIIRVSSNVLSV